MTQKPPQNYFVFKYEGTTEGGGVYSFPELFPLCGTSGKQLGLFVNVCYFSHSWYIDMTNTHMMKLYGGRILMSMLSTSKDIWCSRMAHSY